MSSEIKTWQVVLVRVFAVALVVLAGVWVFQMGSEGISSTQTSQSTITEDESSPHLTFVDHTGRAVSEQDFLGRFALVFFGYTHCPDVCPTDLAIISAAMDELGETAEVVQPLFITYDWDRDTPEVLADFVQHFHPRLIGLTGSQDQIARAVKSYGTYAEKIELEDTGGEYLISHTAEVYFLGPDGDGLEIFQHGADPKEMANTMRAHINREDGPNA